MNFGTIWGGTSLAKATTKVAEAKTKLREATDAGTDGAPGRGDGRDSSAITTHDYTSAVELKDLQHAELEKAQTEVDGRDNDVLATEGKCVALESDVVAALRAVLLVREIHGGSPVEVWLLALTIPARCARCAHAMSYDQMARATEEPSKLES